MARYSDWVPRLRAAIADRWETPWAWGSFDCCVGACDLVVAISGRDPMAALRTYSTERGAVRVLRRYAPKGTPVPELLEAVAVRLGREGGYPEVPVMRAQRGSIVLAHAPQESGPTPVLAIVSLDATHIITPKSDGGWAMMPLTFARRAWQVV